MVIVRRSEDRGHARLGWLDGRHSFSFADYYDPRHMGFRSLRVINEDRIAPGGGFPTHPHRDMEIVTYMIDGALEHRDTLGSHEVIRAGETQRMSAGTGVRHSEFNADPTRSAHLLQIWILPEQRGGAPGYEQKAFPVADKRGRLLAVATRDGADGALTVAQDAAIYATVLAAGESVSHGLATGRGAWVQVVRGDLTVNGVALSAGDGAAVEDESLITLAGSGEEAEALLFDLA
jgi:quercetin 2,3-dioxygenase